MLIYTLTHPACRHSRIPALMQVAARAGGRACGGGTRRGRDRSPKTSGSRRGGTCTVGSSHAAGVDQEGVQAGHPPRRHERVSAPRTPRHPSARSSPPPSHVTLSSQLRSRLLRHRLTCASCTYLASVCAQLRARRGRWRRTRGCLASAHEAEAEVGLRRAGARGGGEAGDARGTGEARGIAAAKGTHPRRMCIPMVACRAPARQREHVDKARGTR